jgi:hypothetical protein
MALIDSVFPTRKEAYENLSNQWLRTRDRFPLFGVAEAIALLESELKTPPENSALKQISQNPMDIDDYFMPK